MDYKYTLGHRNGRRSRAGERTIGFQLRGDKWLGLVTPILYPPLKFIMKPCAHKYNRAHLDPAVRTKKSFVLYAVDRESFAGTIVVFIFVNDETHVVRLKLYLIKLTVKLADTSLVVWTVRFLLYPVYLGTDGMHFFIHVRPTIQLIYPAENLTVRKGYDLPVLLGNINRELQVPVRFAEPTAVYFIYVLLTSLLLSRNQSLPSFTDQYRHTD